MRDVIAILPTEITGFGIGSEVYYKDKVIIDKRTCDKFLRDLLKKESISEKYMKENMREICQVKRNLPWCVNAYNVFFAFKYRNSTYDRQKRGFVNCFFVKGVDGSDIVLSNNMRISTLSREKSLRQNLSHARKVMYMAIAKSLYLEKTRGKEIHIHSLDFLF